MVSIGGKNVALDADHLNPFEAAERRVLPDFLAANDKILCAACVDVAAMVKGGGNALIGNPA